MIKASSELLSQTVNKYRVADYLCSWLGRDRWTEKCNVHQLTFECWAVGIWVKEEGTIISYADFAEYLKEAARWKAEPLEVVSLCQKAWRVEGNSKPWYTVQELFGGYKCDCMLWRCRNKRLKDELPQLLKHSGVFCHHTIAVKLFKNS
ncbi:MAG: hypothetical protein F6K45_23155 [Kamptonema sp. SIO1D9]|nr:hypothetical protein [Kamptonema sp. SIO1D9]